MWLPVPDFHGYYEVSDDGRVRSLPRVVPRGEGMYRVQGRVLRPVLGDQGYHQVTLRRPGAVRVAKVHHLVLEAFTGPRPVGAEARHLDDNRADNRLANLTWGTHSDNQQDRMRNGRHRNGHDLITHCPRRHELVAPNLVPSDARRGRRSCLACKRTQSATYRLTPTAREGLDLQAMSDQYYAEITGGP